MKTNYFVCLLTVAYLALLVKVIVFKLPIDPAQLAELNIWNQLSQGNYVPLKTILIYLSGEPSWNIAIRNIGGNIIPFIPLGLFIPLIHKRLSKFGYVFVIAFILSLMLEAMQILFQVGVFDIDDLILNVLGAIIGYTVFLGTMSLFDIIKRSFPQNTRRP